MKTVIELLEYMKIPKEMADTADIRPNLKTVITLLKKGKVESAEKQYELYISKGVLYLTKQEIINRRTKRNNKKFRSKYGNNWCGRTKKKAIYIKKLNFKQNGKCNICKQNLTTGTGEIDHIIRIHDGGKHELSNMQLLCTKCHDEKDNYKKGIKADGINDINISTRLLFTN